MVREVQAWRVVDVRRIGGQSMVKVYVEGGGESKELKARCKEGSKV
jgi:hypothetical protein